MNKRRRKSTSDTVRSATLAGATHVKAPLGGKNLMRFCLFPCCHETHELADNAAVAFVRNARPRLARGSGIITTASCFNSASDNNGPRGGLEALHDFEQGCSNL